MTMREREREAATAQDAGDKSRNPARLAEVGRLGAQLIV